MCTWFLGEHRSCCRKIFLNDLSCHIVLGRGHLFFEKLGVRAVVTSEQSPHVLLPLTSFGPQGHKIAAEIQPRISSDECAIYWATCDSSRQDKIHSWIAQHLTAGHQKLISMAEQPFCQDLTERRRTSVRFLGQQSEMTIDDTWPQTGEMRSLWKGTTEFGTRDMPQDTTWRPTRHHSHTIPPFLTAVTEVRLFLISVSFSSLSLSLFIFIFISSHMPLFLFLLSISLSLSCLLSLILSSCLFLSMTMTMITRVSLFHSSLT